jgi:hypothetical protein
LDADRAQIENILTSLGTLYLQKFALTSPTSGGRLVGIVRSRIKATELLLNVYGIKGGLWNSIVRTWPNLIRVELCKGKNKTV